MQSSAVMGAGVRDAGERVKERDHELRAALYGMEAAVLGLSEGREQLPDRQVGELLEGLCAEVRRVRNLLDGRAAPASTFDLGDALRPAIACARASGLDVSFFLPPGVEVEGRRESAAQVLVALLDNVRVHADSSPVDVIIAPLDDVVMVFVEDRGCGIPAELRQRVFERGVTGAESSGSGIGLHVAHRLMAEQGGSITVRARRGGGTSFVLRFRRPQP